MRPGTVRANTCARSSSLSDLEKSVFSARVTPPQKTVKGTTDPKHELGSHTHMRTHMRRYEVHVAHVRKANLFKAKGSTNKHTQPAHENTCLQSQGDYCIAFIKHVVVIVAFYC